MRPILLSLTLLAICSGCGRKQVHPAAYTAPPGFSIEPAAPSAQLGPLAAFTFDSLGRPVVVKARRFATLLLDRNRDGIFETEKILTTRVSAVRGIWFDGRAMYLIGTGEEGQFGLYRLEDKNGDDEMDSFEQLSTFATVPGDTGPHDIRRGPDGRPTLAVGAALSRWNEESRDLTAIATGMGNPQAHAYSPDGEAFVSDRGKEGDAGLPSYGGSRRLHAIPGGDFTHPPHRLDSLPPMPQPAAPLEFYRHRVYPLGYRGAMFEVRLPGSRIGAARLRPLGATFDAIPLAGEFVLALAPEITAMEVGPDGFLYFSCGGAGSRGGLFRIRYTPGWRERWQQLVAGPRAPENAVALARQNQPLSSWGHAALQKQKELLGANWGEFLETLAGDTRAAADDRVQAILLLWRFGPRPKPELVERWLKDADPRIRAAAISAGAKRKEAAAAAGLDDPDPRVRRKAAEALATAGASIDGLFRLLSEPDRFVRSSARHALEGLPRELWQPRVLAERDPRAMLEAMFALLRAPGAAPDDRDAILERLAELLGDTSRETDLRLDTLRLFSLAASAPGGGTPDRALRRRVAALLLPQFPTGGEPLDRELAEALGRCGEPDAISKILAAIPGGGVNPALQIHYVSCLRSIEEPDWTPAQKEALLAWFHKASNWRIGGGNLIRSLAVLFDEALQTAFTKEESRLARRRFPKLARIGAEAAFSLLSAEEIFDAQMASPATLEARPERGREIFAKRCASCHRSGELGSDFAPDLTGLSARLEKEKILEALLWPHKEVEERYRSIAIETTDGHSLEALLVREDNKVLLLKIPSEANPVSIRKSQVKSRQTTDASIMPPGVLDGLGQADIASLLAFLE